MLKVVATSVWGREKLQTVPSAASGVVVPVAP
jgi:hypothetical protein